MINLLNMIASLRQILFDNHKIANILTKIKFLIFFEYCHGKSSSSWSFQEWVSYFPSSFNFWAKSSWTSWWMSSPQRSSFSFSSSQYCQIFTHNLCSSYWPYWKLAVWAPFIFIARSASRFRYRFTGGISIFRANLRFSRLRSVSPACSARLALFRPRQNTCRLRWTFRRVLIRLGLSVSCRPGEIMLMASHSCSVRCLGSQSTTLSLIAFCCLWPALFTPLLSGSSSCCNRIASLPSKSQSCWTFALPKARTLSCSLAWELQRIAAVCSFPFLPPVNLQYRHWTYSPDLIS